MLLYKLAILLTLTCAAPILSAQTKGAVAFEDCIAYSKSSPTSIPIPIKAGTIFSFGKVVSFAVSDWGYTERANGLLRLYHLPDPRGSREVLIWVPEKSVIEFDMVAQGLGSGAPWGNLSMKRIWSNKIIAHAQAALAKGVQRQPDILQTTEDVKPFDSNDFGNWKYNAEINPMTDEINISFTLDSNTNTGGTITAHPMTLVARYRKNEFEFYLLTNFVIAETRAAAIVCNVRYDKDTPTVAYFTPSSASTGLFFTEPKIQIQRLSRHETFTVEVRPYNEASRYGVFTLHGLRACITKFEQDSGLKIMAK